MARPLTETALLALLMTGAAHAEPGGALALRPAFDPVGRSDFTRQTGAGSLPLRPLLRSGFAPRPAPGRRPLRWSPRPPPPVAPEDAFPTDTPPGPPPSPPPTDRAPVRPAQTEALQLEVWMNGTATGLIAAVSRDPSGALSSEAGELRSLGLRAPRGPGTIALADLPGVRAVYDEADQRLYLSAADAALEPRIIDVRPPPPPPERTPALSGALLDYDLEAETENPLRRSDRFLASASGDFDFRAFGGAAVGGLFEQTFTAEDRGDALRRLASSWTYSDPATLVSEEIGDFINGGFSWTRPIRMAGVEVRRDFSLRPDLITMPTPIVSGSAEVPSTLEVFVNNQPVLADTSLSGTFRLVDVPAVQGYSETRLLLRDAAGVEHAIVAPFYVTPDLLAPGRIDFSGELGFARRNFGVVSDAYDPDLVGSLSVRYGLTRFVTLEAHGETGEGLANLGFGGIGRVGALGVVTAALSGSNDALGEGFLANINFQGRLAALQISGTYQRAFGRYADLAAVTSPEIFQNAAGRFGDPAPRQLSQASASVPLPYRIPWGIDAAVASLTYADQLDGFGRRQDVTSAGVRQSFAGGTSLYATGYVSRYAGERSGFFISLTLPLGASRSSTASVQNAGRGVSATEEAVQQETLEPGSAGWRLAATEGTEAEIAAAVAYRNEAGRGEADVAVVNGQMDAAARFTGGIVFTSARTGLTPWIDGPFALIDAGAPGVPVEVQHRPAGVTDSHGVLLATGLVANETNAVDIDPDSLPADLALASTHAAVVPPSGAGAVYRFAIVKTAPAVLVTLKRPDGRFVPEGSVVRAAAVGEPLEVGYDGQAYLPQGSQAGALTVDLASGGSCLVERLVVSNPTEPQHVATAICR